MEQAEPAADRLPVRLGWYAALAAVTVAYLAHNFRLDRADLTAPLCPPRNDSAALLSLVTTVHEAGWPWLVERVGAPGTAERYDYPLPEHVHYLTIRALSWATGDPFITFNLWCLLSYPVTAVCAMAVMRSCGLSRPIAFALALVYTFLPFHAGRVFSHTMLAYYHTVPLILLPAIWITVGRLPFFGPPDEIGRRGIAVGNRTTGWTVLLAAVVAATSPYYAFFGCFFLAVAGAYRSLSEASWRPVAAGLLAAAVVSAAGFLCSLPFVLAQREHGSNPAVAHRHSNEAEVYCLKVTQLLLPDGDHRIQGLGYVTRLYNTDAPNSNENRDSTLGAVGVVGFLVLLGRLLMARHGPTLLSGLAALNGAALLLGASGGLGGLFNFLVFAQVRCYNRVCVFIAFWSLLAVGILIDRWAARGWRGRGPLAALALGLFGLWDLTSVRQAPHHSELRTHHAGWVDFGNRMEQAMPPGGMVFQLPAASYPEAGVVHAMPDYAHLTCHVYTRTLRWSYGTNRNRRWDEWDRYVAGLPAPEMVRALCLAGFAGVYVDRRGYADHGDGVLAELRTLLGREAVSSGSGEQLLFRLDAATAALRATTSDAGWERAKDRLLTRPCVLCQDGFYPWAPTDPPEPRRAMYRATVRLINPGREPRRVALRMNWKQNSRVDVHICGPSIGLDVHAAPPVDFEPLALEVVLPPGEHLVQFDATPRPIGFARMYCAWIATDVRLEVPD
jgi:hypothetical protein